VRNNFLKAVAAKERMGKGLVELSARDGADACSFPMMCIFRCRLVAQLKAGKR